MKFYALAVMVACLQCSAQSQIAPIDFTQPIHAIDGKIIADSSTPPVPMTLGDVCVQALEAQLDEDRSKSGLEKFKLDELARKIYRAKSATLTVEELSILKERIGKAYGPLIVGSAWRALDPAQR